MSLAPGTTNPGFFSGLAANMNKNPMGWAAGLGMLGQAFAPSPDSWQAKVGGGVAGVAMNKMAADKTAANQKVMMDFLKQNFAGPTAGQATAPGAPGALGLGPMQPPAQMIPMAPTNINVPQASFASMISGESPMTGGQAGVTQNPFVAGLARPLWS